MIESPKPSYEIRGHHLDTYAAFVASGLRPALFAALRASEMKGLRMTDTELPPEYYADVMGFTPEDEDNYLLDLVGTFKKFSELAEDEPIGLVVGKPDAICHACTGAGEHCRVRDQRKYGGGPDVLTGDEFDRNELYIAAEKIGTMDKIKRVGTETLEFTDAPPQVVSKIEMPAGALKETLLYMANRKRL